MSSTKLISWYIWVLSITKRSIQEYFSIYSIMNWFTRLDINNFISLFSIFNLYNCFESYFIIPNTKTAFRNECFRRIIVLLATWHFKYLNSRYFRWVRQITMPEVPSCQENNYASETFPITLTVCVIGILKQNPKQ